MYTSDGWGGVYKIDARQPDLGDFVWNSDLGVRKEGNRPQTRGIALWEDLVIANLPDGRVIAINRDSAKWSGTSRSPSRTSSVTRSVSTPRPSRPKAR